MSIQAQVAGLGTLEFPDGTDPSVIQATVKREVAKRSAGGGAGAAAGAGDSGGETMSVQLPDGSTLNNVPKGTTRSQIAERLKKAGHPMLDDSAGGDQVTYQIKAPNGKTYQIAGPRGATDEQIRAEVLRQHPDAGKSGKSGASEAITPARAFGTAADTALAVGSGALASIAGGVVKATGYGREAVERAVTGHDPGDANEAASKVENFLTVSPKTQGGKAVVGAVSKGLKAFEEWTDKQGEQAASAVLAAGNKAAEVAKRLGAPQSVVDFIDRHKEDLAAGYGAATKTGLNAAPLVVGGEFAKLPGKVGEAIGVRPTETPPPVAAPAPAARAPGSPAAAPLEVAPSTPRAAPSTIGEGPSPAAATSSTGTARARAEAYVRDRLGLSWNAIGDATKAKLERIAADAQGLDKLNPAAVKRQATLESLRVPIQTTAGKLNRDNVQLLREQGAAATTPGRSIVETDVKANRDLRKNVEVLIDRLRGQGASRATATTQEGVGEAVAGRERGREGALTLKERKSEQNYRRLYDTARKTESGATVSSDPIYEFVRGNPEVLNPQIQHLGWLQGWLKKAGIEHEVPGPDGEAMPLTERRGIKLNELDDLRKKAASIATGGGSDGYYAGEVIKAIDESFEKIPKAAKAWKEARDAYKSHQAEFANQGAISRLVGTKGGAYGTDPKVALEDIWRTSIKGGKLEEIRQLKRSLLSGDTAARTAGKKALRELKTETGQDLLREITKGVSTNSAGETNITAEGINNWIKSMGGGTVEGGVEKLNVILGRRATNELMKIREAAQITKTEPTVRNVGSNTWQKVLNWMDDTGLGVTAKHVPFAGPAARELFNRHVATKAGETATSATERAAAKANDAALKRMQKRGELKVPSIFTYGPDPSR